MKKYVDITSNEFWDILYNEACVEGQQAERIEKDLKAITITEAEIRAKAIDEFAHGLKETFNQEFPTNYASTQSYFTLENVRKLVDMEAEQLKEEE